MTPFPPRIERAPGGCISVCSSYAVRIWPRASRLRQYCGRRREFPRLGVCSQRPGHPMNLSPIGEFRTGRSSGKRMIRNPRIRIRPLLRPCGLSATCDPEGENSRIGGQVLRIGQTSGRSYIRPNPARRLFKGVAGHVVGKRPSWFEHIGPKVDSIRLRRESLATDAIANAF